MASERCILVTGAGGFIGGRIVETLHLAGGTRVRAGVRRWGSAARIGRFPVEIAHCDVMQTDSLAQALDGVSAVVHCAVGDREVTVEGTRNLLEAARRAGVERVVHLSTVDVYGEASGEVQEDRPLSHSGRPYGDSKLDAERVCEEQCAQGLPVVRLRPTLVHGPFSESWTIEWAQRLQALPWLLAEVDCRGTCNLVYIDDLVAAIRLALVRDSAIGEAFNVNGSERPSWNEYFSALNDAMGLAALRPQNAATSHLSAHLMAPVRATAKLLMARFEEPIMSLYTRSPLAKTVMKIAEGMIKKTPTTAEFTMFSRSVSFSTHKAEELLGYRPAFSMAEALPLSVAWLRHNGYAPPV